MSLDKSQTIKSVSWQGMNKICSFAMNFIIQIVLARLITPDDFGSLAILNAIIGMANIFVESGVSTALVQKKELDGQDVYTAQIISLTVAIFFCVVLIAASGPIAVYYHADSLALPLCVISVVLIFNSINSVFSSLLIRNMEFKKLFFRTVTVLPIAGAIGIFLAYRGFGIWALVIYQISTVALNSVVFIIFSKTKFVFRFSLEKAKEIYAFGIKILFAGIVNSIYDTIRTLVIGGTYSKTELAYYDRAYTYSRYTVQIVNSTVTSVALPLFSRKQESREKMVESARKVVRFSAFVMFPVLTGLAAISKPLIITLLTDKWEACIPFFTVFCFLRIPGVITGIDMQMFYAIGRSDISLKYSFLQLILNVLSLLFILKYGIMAIAMNLLLVEIVSAIILMCLASRIVHYCIKEKLEDIYKPAINSVTLFIITKVVENSISSYSYIVEIIILILVGIMSYIGMSLLMRDSNITMIKSVIGQRKRQ